MAQNCTSSKKEVTSFLQYLAKEITLQDDSTNDLVEVAAGVPIVSRVICDYSGLRLLISLGG